MACVKGSYTGPFPGSFLAGRIQDNVQRRLAVFIAVTENVTSNLHEVAVQHAFVPTRKSLVHFVVRHAEAFFHHLVGLADHLHVAILYAVVNHFDEVTSAAAPEPVATRLTFISPGRDRLENSLYMWPGCRVATGHDAGAEQGAFLTTGYAGADE